MIEKITQYSSGHAVRRALIRHVCKAAMVALWVLMLSISADGHRDTALGTVAAARCLELQGTPLQAPFKNSHVLQDGCSAMVDCTSRTVRFVHFRQLPLYIFTDSYYNMCYLMFAVGCYQFKTIFHNDIKIRTSGCLRVPCVRNFRLP